MSNPVSALADHGLVFRKSSYSQPTGNCVEVADLRGATAVRDSQNPSAGYLLLPATEWAALLSGIRR
ncbi:DUF397 domain-containing protein [Nocardiopsis sp. CC223A]|uniref:DUF397 domain-containing protein n=1 Tax=Nocardiopsis sp. CC223A TaxID=3044051 RepID=UPI00278BB8D8|nr:DUF397 domain-containing protein [Nocardiopsis sp. CC223A]